MTFLLSILPKPLIVLSTFTTNKVSLTMRGGWSGKGVAGVLPQVVANKSGCFLSFVLRNAEVTMLEVRTLITNG